METMTDSSGAAAGPSAAGTRRVDQLLAHYGESHQHATNSAIHCVAIPLIMLSTVGLLYALHPWVAYGFVLFGTAYYMRLGSPVFLAAMAVLSILTVAIIRAMGDAVLPVSVAVFVLAWVAQFVGHKIEGRKPSFFEDLQYLFVGPLFVLAKLFDRLGIRY